MEYYRRKPLPLIDQVLPETVNDALVSAVNHAHTPLPSPALSTPSTEILQDVIPDLGQPAAEKPEPMPSPKALVQQADSILKGDIAGQKAPSTPFEFLSTSSSPPSTYSVQGLVADMHTFVETLAKVISHKPQLLGQKGQASSQDEASVPLLQPQHALQSGEDAQLSFQVHNDSHQSIQVKFLCTDLHSCTGERIPSHAMSVTPPILSLEPDIMASITILVQVPQVLTPGEYSGLLMATELSYLKAVISLNISQ